MQALGRPFAMVPRFFWTVLAFVIYTVAGVAGREHFSQILSNFLAILSYWTAFFIVIVAEEHFIFRRKGGKLGGYDFEVYDEFSKCVQSKLRDNGNNKLIHSWNKGCPWESQESLRGVVELQER